MNAQCCMCLVVGMSSCSAVAAVHIAAILQCDGGILPISHISCNFQRSTAKIAKTTEWGCAQAPSTTTVMVHSPAKWNPDHDLPVNATRKQATGLPTVPPKNASLPPQFRPFQICNFHALLLNARI